MTDAVPPPTIDASGQGVVEGLEIYSTTNTTAAVDPGLRSGPTGRAVFKRLSQS
jgi:hypothetical protein